VRIVVKIGSSTLTRGGRGPNRPLLVQLAAQLARLREQGHQLVLVSSGAVACGRQTLPEAPAPTTLRTRQAMAAIGQPLLMAVWAELLGIYGVTAAQVLLTATDLNSRSRWLLARNTFDALLALGVIPIVNENDTVAVDEIKFGDNDMLSARVAGLVGAARLVLLTDQDGLYDDDPRRNPEARLVPAVDGRLPMALAGAASANGSGVGTGGMASKVQAAELARRSAAEVYIARGDRPEVLLTLEDPASPKTRFAPIGTPLEARKRYILAGRRADGRLHVDAGAVKALHGGSSLLPVGIRRVEGEFEAGDTVAVLDPEAHVIAYGLVAYPASELKLIAGLRSDAITGKLPQPRGDEAIHRDDLVLASGN
jgi:glutamate 5-kinase